MNYEESINYLLSFTDYEKLPGIAYTAANYNLGRMEALLAPLGNPHLGTKTREAPLPWLPAYLITPVTGQASIRLLTCILSVKGRA